MLRPLPNHGTRLYMRVPNDDDDDDDDDDDNDSNGGDILIYWQLIIGNGYIHDFANMSCFCCRRPVLCNIDDCEHSEGDYDIRPGRGRTQRIRRFCQLQIRCVEVGCLSAPKVET